MENDNIPHSNLCNNDERKNSWHRVLSKTGLDRDNFFNLLMVQMNMVIIPFFLLIKIFGVLGLLILVI